MLQQRVLFTVVALPLGIAAVMAGGWIYAGVVALILARAAWEYAALFRSGGGQPSALILVGGVLAIFVVRATSGLVHDGWLLPVLIGLTMVIHLVQFERGRDRAGSDFAATLSGIFYVGLLGSYLILLRQLPDHGEWWLMLTLFAVMLADTSAYFVGITLGTHRLAPRLSPKKSWEGYISGVFFATVGTPLFLLLFRLFGLPDTPAFSLLNAGLLGLVIGIVPTLGDLGISMIKREMHQKDTSDILPGHGGVLDRIDSWLWAMPIGYYLILFLFLNSN
ncbi:MAG: phosphatidate cytidylyltransferase [Chloroflexi bacterium]|nr:phosphatidate cytidylyltransferase [Chloroflexota bacterium]